MIEKNSHTNQTELANQEKAKAKKVSSLRERVFRVCDYLKSKSINITCDEVQKITGGSLRNLAKYIKQWCESKNMNITVSLTSKDGQNIDNSFSDDKKTVSFPMAGAERAAEFIIAEEKYFQYYLKNPDQLPEEFKKEIAKAQNETYEIINKRSREYEVINFQELLYQIETQKIR